MYRIVNIKSVIKAKMCLKATYFSKDLFHFYFKYNQSPKQNVMHAPNEHGQYTFDARRFALLCHSQAQHAIIITVKLIMFPGQLWIDL